ncbi:restriction endonuclease subunit S [Nocardia sp. NBC_01377]
MPLGDLAAIQGGIQKQPKRTAKHNPHPFLRVANVTARGLDLEDIHLIELFDLELDRYRLQKGDLLVVEGNGSASQIGRAAIWDGSIKDAVHQNHLIRVRPNERLDSRYLSLVWNSPSIRQELTMVSSSTSGLHTLSVSKVKRIHIPLPSIDEQHRLVELLEGYLSRLDAASRNLNAVDRRLVALTKSSLEKSFGQGRRVPLGQLIKNISAGKSFGSSNSVAAEDQWGIIKVSAMTWGEFMPDQNKAVPTDLVDPRFEIRQGDLLVSRANTADYVGASVLVGQVRPRLLLSDKSLRVTPGDDIRIEWLWRALQAPSARRQISALATGTKDSMRNISQASLRSVLLPSATLAEQDQALTDFAVVDAAAKRMRASLIDQHSRLSKLRRSLLTAAFSGQLTDHNTALVASADLLPA